MLKANSLNLTARQIKAARALCDWSQEDLASASDLSVATIRKLELGFISPRGKTTEQLRHAFENAGLEFIEPGGVRQRPEEIKIYQGYEGMKTFYDELYLDTRKQGGDIVVVCSSELPFNAAWESHRFSHYERMTVIKDTVKVKCILTEDFETLPATSYCEYRAISKNYINSVPFYVYNDKYAIFVFGANPSPKITVIQSPVVAEAFRHQFYSMWDKATPLNKVEQGIASKRIKA